MQDAFGKNALLFGIAFFFVRASPVIAYVGTAASDRALRAKS